MKNKKERKFHLKRIIIITSIAVMVAISLLILNIRIQIRGNTTYMIGNPNYEDSLYIERSDFEKNFNDRIKEYNYKITEIENKREVIYEFHENMNLRVGFKKNRSTLSFIIFEWKKDMQNEETVSICKALYSIFDSDITDRIMNDNLIESGIISGKIDYESYEYFMPDNHVRFESEERDGVMRLYINDEAMGY